MSAVELDLADPSQWCTAGIVRPASSEFPRPLRFVPRRVVEPRRALTNLRSRNVVLQCPGSPIYDWAADPSFLSDTTAAPDHPS